MPFDVYTSEGNRFLHAVAYELNCNPAKAMRVTKAVLHALRDRLPADEAIQFAQGLPMALKGIYIDQYDVSQTPVIIRSPKKFLDFIFFKGGKYAASDFPDRQEVLAALRAVFFVLENQMDYGQIQHLKKTINKEIVEMIEEYAE